MYGVIRLNLDRLKKDDLIELLNIAGEVEHLFGPMVSVREFQDAVIQAIEAGQAFCIRDAIEITRILGAIFVSPSKNEITWLVVRSSERNKGFGEALIEKAIRALDPRRPIIVQTFDESVTDGRAARRIYQKFGFNETGKAGLNPAGILTVMMRRPSQSETIH